MENIDSTNEPIAQYNKPLDFEQVWLMFKETDRMIQESDRILTERFRETDRQFQESERILNENFAETNRQFKATDKKIKELSNLFTSQWGKLVESLVEGDLIRLLNEKGVKVERTLQRVKGNHKGENYEFDIIAENSTELVIVEVKTTLRPQDVNEFHEKIWKSRKYLPRYHDMKIYGAIAFLVAEGSSERMSENQGFFVIKATGNSASIINHKDFRPKSF